MEIPGAGAIIDVCITHDVPGGSPDLGNYMHACYADLKRTGIAGCAVRPFDGRTIVLLVNGEVWGQAAPALDRYYLVVDGTVSIR